MGIETLGPDVNESRTEFSVNHKGEIRFGLSAIKGMGGNASIAIVTEREKNGPYKDIFDFAQRVEAASVNRKAYESLALSGGFDSFGIPREAYFGTNAKGEVFLDTLVRYGQLYQQEQSNAQNSLFGDANAIEIATPPVPTAEAWSNIERLNKERDLVGIYISAHPLDDFAIVLNSMCNTHCAELADKAELAKRDELSVGGIVTAVRSKFTKTGKPCGFVTIEDFEGSGELAFFGEEWGKWRGMLTEGCSVYVRAKCTQRFRDSDSYDIRVTDIQYLQTVKDQEIDRFTIVVDSDAIDDSVVTDIMTMVEDSPGSTSLFFQIVCKEQGSNLMLHSSAKSIYLKKDLLSYIDANPAMSYRIN